MEAFISTLFICFLSYVFFNLIDSLYQRKSDINLDEFNENFYLDIENNFNNYYLRRVKIMRYFRDEKNFERLKTVLDEKNNLIQKINDLFESNETIGNEYISLKNKLGYEFFNIKPHTRYDVEINDEIFKTSLAQLNVIAWMFSNDYMLYIF